MGDTCVDMRTGKSAGFLRLAFCGGFRDRKELEDNHADVDY